MKIEFEARVLNIEYDEMIRYVEKIGAVKVGCFYQKRYVYDFIPAQKGRWIRLRSDGDKTTLAIKEVKSANIEGTRELEIIVSDFEDTNKILEKLGYTPRTFQENFRIEYIYEGVKLDFDKWPMIPPYLEIEGESKEAVLSTLTKLDIRQEEVTAIDVDAIYNLKYGIVLDTIPCLKFNDDEKKFIRNFYETEI